LYEVDIDAHDYSSEAHSDEECVESESLDLNQGETAEQLVPPSVLEQSKETVDAVNQVDHVEQLLETGLAESENSQPDSLTSETVSSELEEPEQATQSVETADLTPDSVESFLVNNEDDSAE
ncbi:MAG: hypothetical protein VYD83_08460, partial [SAR324 cluster bacterium]|nr:hypothetical protein [SAR324 cluster bacterium]